MHPDGAGHRERLTTSSATRLAGQPVRGYKTTSCCLLGSLLLRVVERRCRLAVSGVPFDINFEVQR